MLARGQLDKLSDVLRTSTAAAGVLQTEFSLQLTRHDETGFACFPHFRFRNAFAETNVHEGLPPCNDYEKHSQYAMSPVACQARVKGPAEPSFGLGKSGFELDDHFPDGIET